jgi:hypothetical protein
MKTPAITQVRSTTTIPSEQPLAWCTDEAHPYCYLDGYVIRVTDVGAFTQRVSSRGIPMGRVLNWSGLVEALTMLGWEPC